LVGFVSGEPSAKNNPVTWPIWKYPYPLYSLYSASSKMVTAIRLRKNIRCFIFCILFSRRSLNYIKIVNSNNRGQKEKSILSSEYSVKDNAYPNENLFHYFRFLQDDQRSMMEVSSTNFAIDTCSPCSSLYLLQSLSLELLELWLEYK
jgi:hypothetical protein